MIVTELSQTDSVLLFKSRITLGVRRNSKYTLNWFNTVHTSYCISLWNALFSILAKSQNPKEKKEKNMFSSLSAYVETWFFSLSLHIEQSYHSGYCMLPFQNLSHNTVVKVFSGEICLPNVNIILSSFASSRA